MNTIIQQRNQINWNRIIDTTDLKMQTRERDYIPHAGPI